jgi:hypothetical protein
MKASKEKNSLTVKIQCSHRQNLLERKTQEKEHVHIYTNRHTHPLRSHVLEGLSPFQLTPSLWGIRNVSMKAYILSCFTLEGHCDNRHKVWFWLFLRTGSFKKRLVRSKEGILSFKRPSTLDYIPEPFCHNISLS